MALSESSKEEKLCEFIKAYADDPYCIELLLLLGKHPYTRFSRLAIANSLNTRWPYIELALKRLLKEEVIKESIERNTYLYSLKSDNTLRSLVSCLAKPENYRWQLWVRQVNQNKIKV